MSDKKDDNDENKTPLSSPRNKSQAAIFMTSSSPPVFISFDELMKASTSVANMALAHEIAVDDDFKLQKLEPPNNSLEKIIKQTMMTAFWDLLRSDLNADPPEYSQALSLLKEVRDEIKGLLLPSQDRIRARIDDEIDLDIVKQQLESNTIDLRSYATFIIDMMGKLCAPVRDQDIVSLKTVEDPVDLYREIFRVLELMKMDMANFTISQMRPYIQQQSVTYERKKFQEYLDAQSKVNIDGLAATKSWLTDVYRGLAQSGNTESLSPNIVLCKAYVQLLYWDENKHFPECCVMDEQRVTQLGACLEGLVLVSTLLLVAGSLCRGAGVQGTVVAAHLTALLVGAASRAEVAARGDALVEQVLVEVGPEAVPGLREALLQATAPPHSVHALLDSKARDFLAGTLSSSHRAPMQIPQGFSAVQSEVTRLSGQFMRIVAHNRNVFGPFYDDIIQAASGVGLL